MKERSAFWDNYKGILIFTVVIGHTLYSYRLDGASIVEFIYMFHMPAFVFTTGFLSKSANCFKKETFLKMFTLYFVFNMAMLVFAWGFMGSNIKMFLPYYSYWYLLSVIFWRLMVKPLEKIKGLFFISIVVALLIGFFKDADNTLSVARTIGFFPFFLLGYQFDFKKIRIAVQKNVFSRWGARIVAIGFFGALYWAACNYRFGFDSLLYIAYKDTNDFILRIILMAVAFGAIGLLYISIPDKKIPLITVWGKNCLLIYLIHRPFTLILQRILPDDFSQSYLLIALVFTVVLMLIFGNNVVNRGFAAITNRVVNCLSTKQYCKQIFVAIFIAALLLKAVTEIF